MRLGDSRTALSAHLNRLLEGQALPRMELARRMGVSDGTLGRIKYGAGNPTLDVIDCIARYFRVNPWDLLRPPEVGSPRGADSAPALVAGLQEEIASLDRQQQRTLLALIRALRDSRGQ